MGVKEYIRSYIPMVEFISQILGKNSEVLLNDLTDLDHSIVVIYNNLITHRQVGDPASDLALRTVKAGRREKRDFIANYRGVSETNQVLRSSTYFIRYEGEIVAMICINTDESCLTDLNETLNKVLGNYQTKMRELEVDPNADARVVADEPAVAAAVNTHEYEHLTTSSKNYATRIVSAYLDEMHIQKDYMKRADKIECVQRLYDQGFFQLKDSVADAADALGASEPSVYRYLQTVRSGNHSENMEVKVDRRAQA
ncbi:transcriptional regulator [Agrilactobacillus yilanensis]|uniref:Transcriptional regulator n=1 Tax=Agrilactobacillus yilanensis TaxID=2485997 RepID=A0ABW4JB06_9LACO|nr:PAS domain-containing protein [Agrilactobacillus yilanensis]